ncbi:MAG: hypothetical protein EAZ55_12875 [Cytophagales bacterium]|nr:MAG: hypothetical protein EAZ55_12875 [Cytophagales bacterium]
MTPLYFFKRCITVTLLLYGSCFNQELKAQKNINPKSQERVLTSAESNQGLSRLQDQKVLVSSKKKITSDKQAQLGIRVRVPNKDNNNSSVNVNKSGKTQQNKYGAAIELKTYQKKQKNSQQQSRAMSSSLVRKVVVSNSSAERRRKSMQMASYKGNIRIQKQPKGSQTSWYRGQLMKPSIYNKGSLKKGTKINKNFMPNMDKSKSKKLQYNSREADWMRPGERDVPKTMKEFKD